MLVDRAIESDELDTPKEDHSINNELAELTKYVEMIISTVRDMESPVTPTSDQLPQATLHLNDLVKLTEEGTHRVLGLTKAIETNRRAMQATLEQLQKKLGSDFSGDLEQLMGMVKADEHRLTDIHVALSFQDLVAQRVAKLVTILNEVQHKYSSSLSCLAIKKKGWAKGGNGGRGDQMLRQLEVSQTTALEQDLVDEILSEFGCSSSSDLISEG